MQITLEEAAFGVEKEIEVRKLDTCAQMQRQGRGTWLAHDQLSHLRRPRPGHQLARIFSGFANLSALPGRGPDHREAVSRL